MLCEPSSNPSITLSPRVFSIELFYFSLFWASTRRCCTIKHWNGARNRFQQLNSFMDWVEATSDNGKSCWSISAAQPLAICENGLIYFIIVCHFEQLMNIVAERWFTARVYATPAEDCDVEQRQILIQLFIESEWSSELSCIPRSATKSVVICHKGLEQYHHSMPRCYFVVRQSPTKLN